MTARKIIMAALTDYKGLIVKRGDNPHLADQAFKALRFLETENLSQQRRGKAMHEALKKITNCNEGNVVKYIQQVDSIALDAVDAEDTATLYEPTFDMWNKDAQP